MEKKTKHDPYITSSPNIKPPRIKFFVIFLCGLIGIIVVMYVVRMPGEHVYQSQANTLSMGLNIPTPTPFAFSDMTIPYLQSRKYDGFLRESRVVAYEGQNYTAYTTGYISDGLQINGLLTIPNTVEPDAGFPAIVFVHGYIPPTSYQTVQNYYDYVDYLARNGYVVFKIDLRGHGNSQGKPSSVYYSSDYVIDTLNAYNALQKLGFVNASKIGLWGHSMAGNITTRALAVKKDIPAISVWAGAVYTYDDWEKYGIQDGSYVPSENNSQQISRRQLLFNEYGPFDSQSAFWKQVPLTNYLDTISGAIQLNHAVDDDVVDIGYSRDLNVLLNKTKIPHELQEYSSGGHNISGSAFNQAMQNTVEFFDRYLK